MKCLRIMMTCCARVGLFTLVFVACTNVSLGQGAVESQTQQSGTEESTEPSLRIAALMTPTASPTPAPQPPQNGKKKPSGDGSEKKEEDGKKEEDPKVSTVKRPDAKGDPEAPVKDEVAIEEDGKVRFNLRGQPWEEVLQWLADASSLSLDWQELPADALNLTTTRAYTLDEARDIINRHLLSRGYSMVLNGELLSVMKLSDIKSSLVPRVAPEELDKMLDHTLCKVSFDLDWLIADEAVDEFSSMMTKAGKISKLSRTNRIEMMDTAASLRDIYHILKEEQSSSGQEQLVRTFRLENRRAAEVIVLLRELLGVDPPPGSGGGGMSMGGMSQMTSVMKQMTQQLQRMASSGSKGGGGREPTKTRLVLNPRENMILVQAMPDQMAIIEKAIEQIDVPVEASDSLLQNMNKMKVYRLETVDPQTLVDLLQELGDMAPGTVLKVDSDKNSIVAFASIADHLTITTLVERLDQSGRSVEVIPLRRLEADYVAGTIRALMAPPAKEENNSRYSYYSRYSYSQPQKNESDEFKVEADIENNRLLVYANKVEMDEIHLLLQKLGEIPDPSVDNGMRVFELSPGDEANDVIDRIRRLWHLDNEIQINLPPKEETVPDPSEEDPAPADDAPVTTTRSSKPRVEVWPPRPTVAAVANSEADEFFAMIEQQTAKPRTHSLEAPEVVSADPSIVQRRPRSVLTFMDDRPSGTGRTGGSGKPPINFSLTPDGRLIVTSDDPAALQAIEDLMREVARPAPRYKVFTLKYATPSWVTLNLEDYFAAENETEQTMTYDYFWGYRPSTQKKSGSPTLGRRRSPTFIYDNFTSTILVRDADRRQLQIIEDLINVYDVPEPADTRSMRVTKIFRLQNSKAEVVAQAVKDVFRDLLSANDKALQKNEENKTQTRVYSYFGGDDAGGDDDTPIRFKGLLSVGVDPTSDTLVISSTASLMDTISELVVELDRAGESSSSLQLVKVDSSVDLRLIQERLNEALGNNQNSGREKQNKNGRDTGQGVPVGRQPGQKGNND